MSGRREKMSAISGLLRMALVAVMAIVFGVAGLVVSAEAAPTRFYLQNVNAPFTPTVRGTWTNSSVTTSKVMGRTKSGVAATSALNDTVNTNPMNGMLLRMVSEPIPAQTIAAGSTLNWVIGARESSTAMNAKFRVHAYVVSNDGATLRGTLLANNNDTGIEWATTATGTVPIGDKSLAAVTAQANDRIVIELGYTAANGVTTFYTGTINYGNTGGTDLASGSTAVTTQPGWFEFSQDFFPGPTDLAASNVQYNNVDLSWTSDCANYSTYTVYRNGAAVSSALACSAGTMTFSDTTVAAAATYNTPGYTVRGGGTITSNDSNAVPVTTPAYTPGTTTGVMSFSAVATNSMTVQVNYSGDDDNNNSLTNFQYANNVGFTSPVTITGATRSGKSWVAMLSGLNDGTLYYFRATFADATGLAGTNPVLGNQATPMNYLMHKGAVLGPKYGSGTWGSNYTCATCHTTNSTNVKRIATAVGGVGLTNAAGTVVTGTAMSATIATGATTNFADNATTNKVCDACHGSTTIYKRGVTNATSGTPAMITGASPPHPADPDCVKCHEHRKGFKVNAGCVSCHANNVAVGVYRVATGAPSIVDTTGALLRTEAYGGHLKALKTETLSVGMDWDTQCLKCHDGHDNTAGVNIPNNIDVGINYLNGYISLGGSATSGSTEAEICWNCHDLTANAVSEWGVNTDTNGTGNNYNFGAVYTNATKTIQTSRWIGSYWTSANFSYKEGWLNNKPNTTDSVTGTTNGGSTHAAAAGTQGIDAVASIRCSYCHDVHNTAALTAGFLGAANDPNGKPYLRGRWVGSPYKEDGAPRQGQAGTYPAANTTTNPWGAVPRGSAAMGTVMGGYWIDQNSGDPIAATYTATQFGGLCDLCHGTTKNGTLLAAEINALNTYGTAGAGWVSALNGHSNAVDEGTDTTTYIAARNIFAGRGGATNQDNQNTLDHPYMLFFGTNVPGDANGGFRVNESVWNYTPTMSGRPKDGGGWVSTGWNNLAGRTLDLNGGTTVTDINANFHSFSCSKCHTPHASRLPALMITNCLDTKNNTWDNAFQVHGTTDTINAGRSISNWSSAQNCHRVGGNDPSDTRDTAANAAGGNQGWNTVTPW